MWCPFNVLLKSQANLDLPIEVFVREHLFIYLLMVYLTTLPVAQNIGLTLRKVEGPSNPRTSLVPTSGL